MFATLQKAIIINKTASRLRFKKYVSICFCHPSNKVYPAVCSATKESNKTTFSFLALANLFNLSAEMTLKAVKRCSQRCESVLALSTPRNVRFAVGRPIRAKCATARLRPLQRRWLEINAYTRAGAKRQRLVAGFFLFFFRCAIFCGGVWHNQAYFGLM